MLVIMTRALLVIDVQEARRTAFSVALAVLRRMHGGVRLQGTVTPGHERYDSGLRDLWLCRAAMCSTRQREAGLPVAEASETAGACQHGRST
jgi:hypothetical protein